MAVFVSRNESSDRVLVWCIRSSLGNAGVIDADPLLWFVQVSGSLSTQKAPE